MCVLPYVPVPVPVPGLPGLPGLTILRPGQQHAWADQDTVRRSPHQMPLPVRGMRLPTHALARPSPPSEQQHADQCRADRLITLGP